MKRLLMNAFGRVLDVWVREGLNEDGCLLRLWNSYFVHPWNTWTLSDFATMCACIPDNNCEEAWFKMAKRELLRMKGSSIEKMIYHHMPRLCNYVAANTPSVLPFEA